MTLAIEVADSPPQPHCIYNTQIHAGAAVLDYWIVN